MKKNKYILISLAVLCGALVIAFIINILFKIESNEILSAEWSAGDALNYVGTMLGATSTFVLSLIAYKQNEKLQALEDNNYVASNSCMVLIVLIYYFLCCKTFKFIQLFHYRFA